MNSDLRTFKAEIHSSKFPWNQRDERSSHVPKVSKRPPSERHLTQRKTFTLHGRAETEKSTAAAQRSDSLNGLLGGG